MTGVRRASPREWVAQHYRDAIEAGTLTPGSEMPSMAKLAERWGISPHTAQRALSILRQEGWIEMRAGKPAIVAERPPETSSEAQP